MTDFSEIAILPDEQKKELCLELLNEFGAKFVTQRGNELQHQCTLNLGGHSDNNSRSASVNYRKLEFNCFVCGNGGDLAWWIAVNRRLDESEVEPWLRQRLGIGSSLPLTDLLRVLDLICHPPKPEKVRLPVYNQKILDRWTNWSMFHPYLTDDRQIPEENLERFKIGYADWDEDFGYRHRIIIPAMWEGNLVGWQGRRLDPADREKYKNSPGFPRDRILFGDVSERKVVVVESPMSVLRHCHQTPMVATYGSNISEPQARYLERFQEVTLFNENDKAGWKMVRFLSNRLKRHVRVNVVQNPYTKEWDPADLDDDTFMELVEGAVPSVIWHPKEYKDLTPYIKKG